MPRFNLGHHMANNNLEKALLSLSENDSKSAEALASITDFCRLLFEQNQSLLARIERLEAKHPDE